MVERPEALAAAVEPIIAALGLRCYDVELTGSGGTRTLRVTIERPDTDAAVDLGAITAVTEALSPALDRIDDPAVADALRAPYTLEVSSPGLERALRRPAHYLGALGTTVSVKARDAGGGAERHRGVLVAADDDGIELDVDGEHLRIRHDDITQARTVFDWGSKPKAAGRGARSKQKVTP